MKKIYGLLLLAPLTLTSCGGGNSIVGHYKDNNVTYNFSTGSETDFKKGINTKLTDVNEISQTIINKLKTSANGYTEDNCLQLSNDYGIEVQLDSGENTTFYACNVTSNSQASFNYGKIQNKYHFVDIQFGYEGRVNLTSYNFSFGPNSETISGVQHWYKGTCGETGFETTDKGLKINFSYIGLHCEVEPSLFIVLPPEDAFEISYVIDFVLEYNKVS